MAWGGIDREGKGQRPLGKDFADTRACKRQTWVVYGRRSALQRSGGLQSLQYCTKERFCNNPAPDGSRTAERKLHTSRPDAPKTVNCLD